MAGRPRGTRRHLALDEVSSTNTVALEAARADDPGPLWITGERQTAGRGRRGRRWASERGNLYGSLLLIDPAEPAALGNLPLVAAVGIRDGIGALAGVDDRRVRIKWPNDILVGGAKTVGILVESERLRSGRQAVVLGAGINVEIWPADAPYPVTGLRREGFAGTLAELFDSVASGVEAALARWDRGRGFRRIRDDWLAQAVGVGESCRLTLADGSVADGRFEALDEAGRLVLRAADGRLTVHSAGDLFLPAARGDSGARASA